MSCRFPSNEGATLDVLLDRQGRNLGITVVYVPIHLGRTWHINCRTCTVVYGTYTVVYMLSWRASSMTRALPLRSKEDEKPFETFWSEQHVFERRIVGQVLEQTTRFSAENHLTRFMEFHLADMTREHLNPPPRTSLSCDRGLARSRPETF